MAKSIKELLEDQRAFEQQKEAPSLADSASTRAPSELSTAGPLIEQDDDDKLERLFKSVGIEVGGGIALGGATTPLLAGGPVGIGSYIAVNALGNLGFNAWAQDVRDPEAEYSKEEGIATTLVNTLGPFATIKKGAQLGKIGKRVLGTAEGAALGASEEAIRQGLELQSGKIKFEELSPTQIGWASGFGAGFGAGATAYSDVNFNKLGASNKTLNEIKRGAELNAVNRLNTIDRTLKVPGVTGELRTLLLKEKDELKTSIESIKLDDREYLQGLREKALGEQKEIEQAIAERLRTSEGTRTGEGTVLRPKEEAGEDIRKKYEDTKLLGGDKDLVVKIATENKNDAVHLSNKETVDFTGTKQVKDSTDPSVNKPQGLYYASGDKWLSHIQEKAPAMSRRGTNAHMLDLNQEVILKLDSTNIKEFEDKYLVKTDFVEGDRIKDNWIEDEQGNLVNKFTTIKQGESGYADAKEALTQQIDWDKMSKDWSGIEVDLESFGNNAPAWTKGWDISQGVIWDKKAYKQATPLKKDKDVLPKATPEMLKARDDLEKQLANKERELDNKTKAFKKLPRAKRKGGKGLSNLRKNIDKLKEQLNTKNEELKKFSIEAEVPKSPEVDEDIPLGTKRSPFIDPNLTNIDGDAFDAVEIKARKELEKLEEEFDGFPMRGTEVDAPIEFKRKLATAQDAYSAVELEKFRRQINGEEPWFIASEFRTLAGGTQNAETVFKLALLGETVKKRGIQDEVLTELKAKIGKDENAKEVFEGQLKNAQEAMDAFKKPAPKPAIEAKPTEAPSTQEITQAPTKLTTEQKMEAIERMGMSDDDLSMFLEGKSELIPINLASFTGEDGIQKSMAAVLEQLSDKIKSGRIKTDKESLIKQATALRKKLDPSLDESAYVTQIARESEDLIYKTVLADSMTFSAFSNWNKKFDANVDLNDPKVVNDLLGDLDRLQVFAESSSTIGSSAGKLLQSRKLFKEDIAAKINTLERKADKLEKGLAEDLIKYSKDLKPGQLKEQLEKLGGLKAMKGFLSELRLIKDPAKLGRLLEISKRSTGEKFGRAAKELVYDSVLSAPPTQAAAASGNAMMSLYSLFNQGVGGLATGDLKQTRMALRTSKYLLHGIQDAWDSAVLASKHSQGSISLNTHYEKIGEKAFAMEATGLKGPIGETVENVGEMLNFGPKGLVFQDEFYRHLFGKAQARAMLAEEYKQLVKRGEAPVEGINDFMNAKMSRYFVDGKRYKTKRDVELDAVTKAREQDLEPKEAKEFMAQYVKDNWNNKLSSELEYVKDFGDKITFQRDLSSEHGVLEAGATKLGELRQKSSVLELVQLFLKTPTNMFMELGGTTSSLALLPGVNKVTFKRTIDELQSENPSIRAQARGRQIVGAGLWASALYLADQQLFTGQGPQDYKELQNKKDTGWQPNALNISATKRFWDTGISNGDQLGDKYMPMSRLGAIADVYGVAATALRAHEDNSMPDDLLGKLTSTAQLALSALISDKTYLKNISEFNDGIFKGKWEEGGKSGINTIMSSINRLAVPSIVRGSAALNDPYLREINGPMDQLKMALGSTRRELSPKRDVLGTPKPSSPYNSIGNAINYLSPLRVSELKTEKATKKDVKEGRALKVGDKMFTKQDEAKRIIAELNGRFSFSSPTDGVTGLDLRKFKVSKDYGFGLEQNLYDRWQQIYSELKPEDAIIKLYNHPKIQRLGNVPKGSPIKDLRKLSIESALGKIRKTALGKLIKETPLLKEQYKLINKIQRETSIEGKDAPRKVTSPALEVLTD